jgi:cytochrome P450
MPAHATSLLPPRTERPKSRSHLPLPPGPSSIGFALTSLNRLQRDSLGFLRALILQYGDVVRIPTLLGSFYLVNHPDGVKHILQENHKNYDKNTLDYNILKSLLGKGLLTDDGPSWLQQRRLIQPKFHRQRVMAFGTLMTDASLALVERWEKHTRDGRALDIAQEMMRLTLYIIGQALFSLDLSAEGATVGCAFTTANRLVTEQTYSPWIPLSVPTPRNRRYRRARQELSDVVYSIIRTRRRNSEDKEDLLSMLLHLRDAETDEGMDDHQLHDEILTFMLAGHETTSNALSWTFYLLSQHPDVEQRLHQELHDILGGRAPTVNDLPNLPYTQWVIAEAMRLYPPAWVVSRHAIADDEIGGYHIPAGSSITISQYLVHRHPVFWEQPDTFDPERFSPERSAGRPHYAYFPFGGGPRQCIGNTFAQLEALLILATIAQHYTLRLVPGSRVELEPLITLRPRHGLPMTLHSRSLA